MKYLAIKNTPGFLPEEEPAIFDRAAAAWGYLADERRDDEDAHQLLDSEITYSDTVDILDAYASAGHGPDIVYGEQPRLAYTVEIAADEAPLCTPGGADEFAGNH